MMKPSSKAVTLSGLLHAFTLICLYLFTHIIVFPVKHEGSFLLTRCDFANSRCQQSTLYYCLRMHAYLLINWTHAERTCTVSIFQCDCCFAQVWRLLPEMPGYDVSEFYKLAQIYITLPPTSVSNERTFSRMNFVKSNTRNRLGIYHLNVCMRLESSPSTYKDYPFERAWQAWMAAKMRRQQNKW